MTALGRLVWTALLVATPVVGCGAAENAAARDPMRCERDPTCSRGRSTYADCTRQCADNPECMDRCRQVQEGVDRTGR